MSKFDLDNPLQNLIRLTTPLPFLAEDKETYPWLGEEDRYYRLERSLDHGGFSNTFLGRPCDAQGTLLTVSPPVVVKIPNLRGGHLARETQKRLEYIEIQSIAEWELIRRKLMKCEHANPIFDVGPVYAQSPLMPLFVTVQPYLSNAVSLKQWMVNQKLRGKISIDDDGKEIQDWQGISQWRDWLKLAIIVADGLVELHQRRVIHGDIWPPNIYITNPPSEHVVFIDFGESFVVTPSGEPRIQPNHAYRAPERDKAEYVPTEQIDVYSFGKLLLYLAIGKDHIIPREINSQLLYGHRRRAYIRDLLFYGNAEMAKSHPELLDTISQCVAMDPVGRPSMLEISDQLHEFDKALSSPTFDAGPDLSIRLAKLSATAKAGHASSVFRRMIDRKMLEVERLIDSCQTEMIEITGTRDVLIAALVALFGELNYGDSWTTLTTPSVWQKNALGLDGRYTTATIHALKRGAAVHRTYIISVEEIGATWAKRLSEKLKDTGELALKKLSKALDRAIFEYEFYSTGDDYRPRTNDFVDCHQRRLVEVARSLSDMVRYSNLQGQLTAELYSGVRTTSGLYLGLIPVATLAKVREYKTQNAHSLMYSGKAASDLDRWLLVMTDIRGRNENEPFNYDVNSFALGSSDEPQLRRVRVYKSVMGIPNDRIISMERLLMAESFNIGASVERFAKCLSEADEAYRSAG